MGRTHRVGIIGLGVISGVYLETLTDVDDVIITAVADLDPARAEAVAVTLPHARALSVEELLAASDVDVVLNLTIPAAHAEIAEAAIRHGKDVFGEKPLTARLDDGVRVMAAADAAGVRVGCAPDTVLGTGIQTARALVDEGRIGRPLAATAVMATAGHERWHPNPDFYYAPGGGPLLDMGPYYVTSLVHLLGPVTAVIGAGSRLRAERVIGSGPRVGESVPVLIDSHVTGVLTHASGALSTLIMSFDSAATTAAPIEVHGEAGSLRVPDPNGFDGTCAVRQVGEGEWTDSEPLAGVVGAARGAGLVDMLRASGGRTARADGQLALHVLEVMTALLQSAESGCRVEIASTAERPALVPLTEGLAALQG
ncbi:Gfo/Idh/MocA family oxidoreductase [Microbacterium sp. H1-D42]|uniref:Gfo/Idh/MocA family protein n=1 Tax=Microbacterium sp. H1-D42 TaxID=2925844 RepID=UPI001F537696|nr:Gfo/Idh/MocA family oxidoreductase [Microbacterium sp. H1-D42]UNK70488.1 Gfo/Idh/MocA family oxidoreductase [Microbacterium sp. H1-D42]